MSASPDMKQAGDLVGKIAQLINGESVDHLVAMTALITLYARVVVDHPCCWHNAATHAQQIAALITTRQQQMQRVADGTPTAAELDAVKGIAAAELTRFTLQPRAR